MTACIAESGSYVVVAQASPTTSALSYIFSLLIHLIVLSAVVVAAVYLVRLTFWGYGSSRSLAPARPFEEPEPSIRFEQEVLVRIFALVGAALTVFLAKAIGLSIPELLTRSLSITNPIRFTALGIVSPAALGILVAWYFVAAIRNRDDRSLRVMIFVGGLMVFIFSDVYAAAVQAAGFGPTGALAPNVSFLLAVALYCVAKLPGRGLSHKQTR